MSTLVLQRKQSKIYLELNAIVPIAARDITLLFKSPAVLIVSLAMPLVMMGMLGGSLAQNMASGLGFNYGQFMMIGMLVNMLFMMTTMGISSLVEDHTTDFTQEMLISPVSRYSIVIGKIVGSSFSAILGMFGTMIVGMFMGIALSVTQWICIFALSPIICLAAGSMAMIVIGLIKSTRVANMVVTMIPMAQMFLSGAIIPINNSSGVLFVLSRIMPMTYCLDLVRCVVYAGTPEYATVVLFNPMLDVIVIAAMIVVCLVLGTYFFAKSEKDR